MNENFNNSDTIEQNICRACLETSCGTRPMSIDEIHWYQTIVLVPNMQFEMKICTICSHVLKRFSKFMKQCQNADFVLGQVISQDTKSQHYKKLKTSHDYNTIKINSYYIGPQIELGDLKQEGSDNDSIQFEIDDDIPLMMLRSDTNTIDESKTEMKRKKTKNNEGKANKMSREVTGDIRQESSLDENSLTKVKSKSVRVLREGFTSRMVQETEEYVVIKLNKEQVLQEMQEKRESEKYKRSLFKCEKCVKGFNFEDVLQGHMERHSQEFGEFQCDICFQYCPSKVSLRGHFKSHTTRYKCKVCGDVRLSRQHLLEHHTISHSAAAALYTCDHCYFTTNKRTVIQRHVRTHTSRERRACHQCGRLFRTAESLRVHAARHDKTKALQCSECSRKFIYPSLLRRHELSAHVHKDYYCVECDTRFNTRDNLRLHFKKAKKHRDSSSYNHKCSYCDESFVSSASLQVHLTTHHGHPKSNACDLCGRLYSSRESLKGHIRRVHGDKQPAEFGCEVCKKVFTRKSVLTVHMRTHSVVSTAQ